MILNIILMSMFLSLDSLSIGATYGLRKIKIPTLAKIIITVQSFLITLIAIMFGNILNFFLSEKVTEILGFTLLVLLGLWFIFQSKFENNCPKKMSDKKKDDTLFSFIIKSLGISIKILRTPEYCDIDNSNIIEPKEALYLGLAMSTDCFIAGISATTMNLNVYLLPFLIPFFQILFLSLGVFVTSKISIKKIDDSFISILSGVVLILIGATKLF